MGHFNRKKIATIKVIVLFIISLIVGLFPADQASACTCFPPPIPEERFNESDAVFTGRVVSIRPNPAGIHLPIIGDTIRASDRRIGIRVDQSWKGVTSDLVYVTTGGGWGDCGYVTYVGTTHLFYVNTPSNDFYTTFCFGTTPYESATEDLNYLNQLQELPLTHKLRVEVIILLMVLTIIFLVVASYFFYKKSSNHKQN